MEKYVGVCVCVSTNFSLSKRSQVNERAGLSSSVQAHLKVELVESLIYFCQMMCQYQK